MAFGIKPGHRWILLYCQRATRRIGSDCRTPSGVAFDGANIWTANFGTSNVTKLRASDGAVLGTFPAGAGPNGICFDGANTWVTDFNSTTVTELLASSGAMIGMFTVGSAPQEAAFDGAQIWVTNFNGTTVSKL